MTFRGKEIGAGLLKHALTMGSAGAGVVVAYALWDLVKAEPHAVLDIVRSWGPMFVIVVMGGVFVDRRVGEIVQVGKDNAVSSRELATAVQKIADKDDQRAREQELLLDHLSKTNSKIFDALDEIKEGVKQNRSRGAGAN